MYGQKAKKHMVFLIKKRKPTTTIVIDHTEVPETEIPACGCICSGLGEKETHQLNVVGKIKYPCAGSRFLDAYAGSRFLDAYAGS